MGVFPRLPLTDLRIDTRPPRNFHAYQAVESLPDFEAFEIPETLFLIIITFSSFLN